MTTGDTSTLGTMPATSSSVAGGSTAPLASLPPTAPPAAPSSSYADGSQLADHLKSGKDAQKLVLSHSYTYFRAPAPVNTKVSSSRPIAQAAEPTSKKAVRFDHESALQVEKSTAQSDVILSPSRNATSSAPKHSKPAVPINGQLPIGATDSEHEGEWPRPIVKDPHRYIDSPSTVREADLNDVQKQWLKQYGAADDPRSAFYSLEDKLDPNWPFWLRLRDWPTYSCNAFSILKRNAADHPDRRAMIYLDDSRRVMVDWTFGQMYERVQALAHYFDTVLKVQAGERLLLCFVPGPEFFLAFWACLAVGACAIPVCPQDVFNTGSDGADKLDAIVQNCGATKFITTQQYVTAIGAAKSFNGESATATPTQQRHFDVMTAEWLTIDAYMKSTATTRQYPCIRYSDDANSLAFLQYTSGSTGSAKGVMVTHKNLLRNSIECMSMTRVGAQFKYWYTGCAVSWLPHFHDMGLIGFHTSVLLTHAPVIYFSPIDFMHQPTMWLHAMSEVSKFGYKHVISGAPSFALDLCVDRVTDDEMRQIDLSGLTCLILGAEPVLRSSMMRFAQKFAPVGFNSNSFVPAYGMAENTLIVISKKDNTYSPHCIRVDTQQLNQGKVVEVTAEHANSKWLVSSGEVECDHPSYRELGVSDPQLFVVIVDSSKAAEVVDGTVGEIWISSQSTTAGYYNNTAATQQTFQNKLKSATTARGQRALQESRSMMASGDLGVWYNKQLYIVGRAKDMIIINGSNLYSQDLEAVVRVNVDACRPGSICAVATQLPGSELEHLAIIAEVKPRTSDGEFASASQPTWSDAVAVKAFKLSQALPSWLSQPLIRCSARLAGACKKSKPPADEEDTEADVTVLGYSEQELTQIISAVRRAVQLKFGIPASDVIIAKPHTVLKTSSGKLRRVATKQYIEGEEGRARILRRSTVVRMQQKPAAVNGEAANSTKLTIAQLAANYKDPAADITVTRTVSYEKRLAPAFALKLQQQRQFAAEQNSPDVDSTTEVETIQRALLDSADCKQRLIRLLAAELHLSTGSVEQMAADFQFDESKTLEDYGLDSVAAMRLAGQCSKEFRLTVPLSPFMLLVDPTLEGVVKVIQKLHAQSAVIDSAAGNADIDDAAAYYVARDKSELPTIYGVGCVLPGPGAPAFRVAEVMEDGLQLDPKKLGLFRRIVESAGIERRYSVLPSPEAIYFGRRGLGNDEGVEPRNDVYRKEAGSLAHEACTEALRDWGGQRSDITHVVAVSCTGVVVPGVEFIVMRSLGLSESVQRLNIGFMGCFGFLSGLKVATAIAEANHQHRVLMVCVELCSLHMQLDDRADNLVGSAIFSDGSSAVVIGCGQRETERAIYRVHKSASVVIPNTLEYMDWILSKSGMVIGLDKQIPQQIYENIPKFLQQLLSNTEAYGVEAADMTHAVHPGGPMVLNAIGDSLSVSKADCWGSWEVLRRFGNMSSATLGFVLQEIRRDVTEDANKAGKASGEPTTAATGKPQRLAPSSLKVTQRQMVKRWVPTIAFGPGLNVEGALLECCLVHDQ